MQSAQRNCFVKAVFDKKAIFRRGKEAKDVASLKQSLKHVLIHRQQKRYEKELTAKKMSYDTWIKKQERAIRIDDIIVRETKKCLTTEIQEDSDARDEEENEGLHSKNVVACRFFEVFNEKSPQKEKISFCMLPPEVSCETKTSKMRSILENCEADVILFQVSDGELADFALPLLYGKLCENKNIILIYGDEDVVKDGIRQNPWLKPDWSPDTFLSGFYFGSLVAVRRNELLAAVEELTDTSENMLYCLCERVLKTGGGFEIRKDNKEMPAVHIPEILFHSKTEGYYMVNKWELPEEEQDNQNNERKDKTKNENSRSLVSVIIPSKDNPAVLFTCIHSLIEKTECEFPYEILIMDNGSNAENKACIEKEVLRFNQVVQETKNFCGIKYYYRSMVFNFSRMCNMGAGLSKGEFLLFLNDDMEIIQSNWLTLLMQKAMLSYAGAVGAKLLYPDSTVIQHAGITNLRVGPAHKLQFLSDEENHYYGKNRGVHDMLAVTGACLLVKKRIFEKVGGFCEELAVAFNDVDLCYQIYEAGYYNVQRNDVMLYHHESLSRGKDGESEEKQLRLLREKDILYERHQNIYGSDPFYHKYLTNDMLESDYSPGFRYQVTLDMPWAKVTAIERLPENIREDSCVVIGMECAMDIYKWKYGISSEKGEKEPDSEDVGYYFQGYSFIIGSDNACYKKTLLLENKENKQIFYIDIEDRYRPDIRKNLKDQLNVDLTGFAAKVRFADIPEGEYRFGMLAEDKCSRLKLVNFSSWVLQKEGN